VDIVPGSNLDIALIFNRLSSTGLSSTRQLSPTATPQKCGISRVIFSDSEKKNRKKKTKKKTRTKDGLSSHISTAQLQSPSELDALFRQYTGDVIKFDFWALACRAVRKGSNPPGLFRKLLADNAVSHISGDDEDEAARLIRRLHQDGEPCELVKGMVARLVSQFRVERPPSHAQRRQELDRQFAELEKEYAR